MEKYVQNKTLKFLNNNRYYLLLLTAFCIISCQSDINDPSAVVKKWIGRKISFPSNIPCSRLGERTPCETIMATYKVLVYTDSLGCVSCDLRIDEWKKIISNAEKSNPGMLSFHFYFNPKKGEELSDLFKRENFKEQVYIDKEDLLNRENKLPKQMAYQCFLLNENDEVVLVGNPTLNSNMNKLYMDLIHGKFIPNQVKKQ